MTWQRPPTELCLSNLAMDRLLGRELDEDTRRAARDHLAGCPRCSARLLLIEGERDDFRRSPPAISLPEPAAPRRIPLLVLGSTGALGAALAVLVFVQSGPPAAAPPAAAPGDELTRSKGGIRLGVYIKRGESVQPGRSGDVVHPGDAIRFTYSSASDGYLAIVSRDGSGRVSVYFPDGSEAAAVGIAEQEVLPDSIILDGVLGPEVIYGVHCRSPVRLARITEALERAGSSPEPSLSPETSLSIDGCTVDGLTLDKRP